MTLIWPTFPVPLSQAMEHFSFCLLFWFYSQQLYCCNSVSQLSSTSLSTAAGVYFQQKCSTKHTRCTTDSQISNSVMNIEKPTQYISVNRDQNRLNTGLAFIPQTEAQLDKKSQCCFACAGIMFKLLTVILQVHIYCR